MNEELEVREQPNCVTATVAEANNDELSINDNMGSLGKFKNANSLLKAYEDLEKEFTRKSQRLSELEKSIEKDNVEKSTPSYAKSDWQEKTKEFLSNNSEAKDFAEEISKILFEDKDLACLPNSLELAYAKVLASKYRSNEELVKDDQFLENFIYNDEKIKNTIIKKYLSEVNNNHVPPIVLNSKGTTVGFVAPEKPKNLSEAKLAVERLFTS